MANDLVAMFKMDELARLPVGEYRLTMDPREKANRMALACAVQGKPPSLADSVNLEIEVVHLLYHRIEIDDDATGEVKNMGRLCLFCTDGKVYSTSGSKAIKDALMPATLFGLELPYEPPQKFKITKTKTGPDGRGYINLEWIGG